MNDTFMGSTRFPEGAPGREQAADAVDEYLFILPIIVILGLSGNLISLVTIFHSRIRHVNANVYLIVLTTADSAFLIGVLLICFKVDWIRFEYCVGVEYLLTTASYVASWSTAALTIERYLAIAHPLRHVRYGHVDRVRMLVYWLPIPFILQIWQFISIKPTDIANGRACELKEANYQIIAQALDTLICYLIPCSVIVVLNLLVALKLRKATNFEANEPTKGGHRNSRRQGGTTSTSGAWTTILWVMPLVFVVLNTPFHVTIMAEVVFQVVYKEDSSMIDRPNWFLFIYNTAHYMLYINAAIDVLVYAFSSANFRKTAVIAWRRILCPRYAANIKATNGDRTSRFSFRATSVMEKDSRAATIRNYSPVRQSLVETKVTFQNSTC